MPKLVKTSAGRLLRWERGTTRYTLGYRFGRFKPGIRLRCTNPNIHTRRFGVHLVRWPMTEVEKRQRGLS